ncbi:endonuclease/exonuclease/phosphatase family protein [Bifidobacterium leontopitheci]|uniref:Endonuclease n=1 Tax=Bifidobacterium leontopitheci TaxID=2650774 RepID=A0A6I1GLK0_9BIFI|nr:endonuclease/exonuclease/phosphatase family protein [Bifidobacterium leontopitheci]KAB7790247.1 endonuclease [Bifidobacterium leontopitheci]
MTIALWIVLVLCIAWTALRWLPAGAEAHMPFPYVIALIRFLWVPYLLVACVAAPLGHWVTFGMAVAGMLSIGALQGPYWRRIFHRTSRETSRETPAGDPRTELRVMTLNCRYGRANADDIVAAVRERRIDVLALQELSKDLVKRLDAAGLPDLLPYRQLGVPQKDTDNGGFNGLWSRTKPVSSTETMVTIPAADVPGMTFALDEVHGRKSAIVAFASAHTKSPMRGPREWSNGIRRLAAMTAFGDTTGDQANNRIAVVMGDLNAVLDHPSFRELLRSGLTDASLQESRGHTNSFPSQVPWPRIELDHVLFTGGVTAHDVASFVVRDTDHLALTATLELQAD